MKRVLLCAAGVALSAVLLVLALPPARLGELGWICQIPLLLAVRGAGLAWGALSGIACAMLAAWITDKGFFYDLPRLEGDAAWHYTGFLLFALPIVVLGAILGERKSFGRFEALGLAALAVSLESVLVFVLPAHLALTQYESAAMVRLSSVTGIWGVSYLVWVANLLLPASASRSPDSGTSRVRGVWLPASLSMLLALPGVLTIDRFKEQGGTVRSPGAGEALVAALQTTSGDPEELEAMHRAAGSEPEFVVWPELSAIAMAAGGDTSNLIELASEPGVAPIVTTFQDGTAPKPFNASSLFSQSGESERYFKRKLFGGETAMHNPGKNAVSADLRGTAIGLNVCFDSCYGSILRDTALLEPAPKVITLPCMGPESPYGFVQAIHGAFTPFRSAELGLPIVRAESSAFAMITDRDGRIVAQAPPGYVGAISGVVTLGPAETLYRRVGDLFLWLCWGGTALWIALLARRALQRRKIGASHSSQDLESTWPASDSS
jgi:apolipoprotein N-acyltransferase